MKRCRKLAVALAVTAGLATGCGALPSDSAVPSAETPGASGVTGQTFEEDLQLAERLTEQFWARRFEESGGAYQPIRDFVPYRGDGGPDCGGEPSVPNNAFYCPAGHFVAYDEDWMRGLYAQMGDASVYLVLMHEIGHAVQAQLGTDLGGSQERELQADCYAGGVLGGLVAAGQLTADEGDDRELLTNLAAAGDPEDAWWRPDAHGTAGQRQQAFATGYDGGVGAC